MPVRGQCLRARPGACALGQRGQLRRYRGGASARSSRSLEVCYWFLRQASSANFLEVDAVLRDDDLQVLRIALKVRAPLVGEDLGLVGIRPEHYAHVVRLKDHRMLGEPSPSDGIP